MESHCPSETSLQQVLQSSTATPEFIQVKPRGLKAILTMLLDFLEAQQIQATLITKLPRSQIWREDIEYYCRITHPGTQGYCLTRHLEKSAADDSVLTLVPLSSPQCWRGDYFVIVLTAELSIIITAHRLQTASARRSSTLAASTHLQNTQSGASQSNYLEVCLSVHTSLIADMLEATTRLIAPAYDELRQQIQDWERRLWAQPRWSPALLDKWLVWQLKVQESLRQSAATYRKQALTASSLSSQNEVLINTLRLKDDFLNTVGQELRTPLTTIKTALTLLSSSSLRPSQRERYMEMIAHECNRQNALIQGVLNLLQIETNLGGARLDPVRLVDILPPVISTYQPLAQEKGIMLAYTVPEDLPAVACPESWLRQIMIHLLNNSIRFTEDGGEVWITAHQSEEMAELEVRDTGVGIAREEIGTIFEHFARGRNLPDGEVEGAGLGLSIVQQLLVSCGGSICVTSQPGQGSTFQVRLPFYQD